MAYRMKPLGREHCSSVLEIYNYYITETTCAFREEPVDEKHYLQLIEPSENHRGYAVIHPDHRVIGLCMLKPHHHLPVFSRTAEVLYFLHKDHTGKGAGSFVLSELEKEAAQMGIRQLLASITSENRASIEFHRKHGFEQYGLMKHIGEKFGRTFSVLWMGKSIT